MKELVSAATAAYPNDTFFAQFDQSCRANPAKLRAYRTYDDAFRVLDSVSWEILKNKAVSHFRDHRPGQLKQGFFNQLNDAFAYRHLVRHGYSPVRVLKELGRRTPDIRYRDTGNDRFCEVKTINISDEEIARRGSAKGFSNVYVRLTDGFLEKFATTVRTASEQIAAAGPGGLIYVVMILDDIALDNYGAYRQQLRTFARELGFGSVYVKVGLRFSRRMGLRGLAAGGGPT